MRRHPHYRLAIVAAFVALSAAAGIYKWVDEKGVTQYGETPPPGTQAREIAIQPPPAPDTAREPAPTWQEQEREFEKRRLQRAAAEEGERQADLAKRRQAAVMKSRCGQAHKDLHVLEVKLPAYTIDERGERVYVEDKDRPAAIEFAKRRIAENCVPP